MIRIFLGVMSVLLTSHAMAILPSAIQPDEFSVLPAYCKAKLSDDPSDDKAYSAMIGPDWVHIHHYCFALNFTNRFYKTSDQNDKKHYMSSSLNNHDYVLTHSTPDFWMRPLIHTEKAKQLQAAKRYAESLSEANKALQISPKYVSAYVVLADVYRDLNKRTEAVSAVERGLHFEPGNKLLQRRYKSLFGKDYVAPVIAPDLVDESVASHPPSQTEDLGGTARPTETKATEAATEQVEPRPSTPSVPGEMGSPTNPYCRFCP